MIYYTVYVKGLRNSTGYIDVALKDDQLLKDFQQFLDLGLKASRTYLVVDPGGASATKGSFVVNLSEVAAITTVVSS